MPRRYPNNSFGRGTPVAAPSAIPAGMLPTMIDVGDSLTAGDQWGPHHWHTGVLGAPFESVLNCGFYGQSVGGCYTQITTNAWTDSNDPGLVGAPAVGLIRLRIGTNDARSPASPITDAYKAKYRQIIDFCLTKAQYLAIYSLPPVGGVTQPKADQIYTWNDYFATLPSIYPGKVWYVDDAKDLKDGSGNIIPAYYDTTDEVHMSGAGQLQMLDTAHAAHVAMFANQTFVDPLAGIAGYSDNFVVNSLMTGTGGNGNGWGQVVNGGVLSPNGAGVTGTCSIVAADVGDSITAPWQRITPTGFGVNTSIELRLDGVTRTFGADDPDWLEQMVQLRFNGVNGNIIHRTRFWLQADGQNIGNESYVKTNQAPSVSRLLTYRRTHRRASPSTGVVGSKGTQIYIYITSENGGSGSMGSIDIRCPVIRG